MEKSSSADSGSYFTDASSSSTVPLKSGEPIKGYSCKYFLGIGSFGTVHLYQKDSGNTLHAIKAIPIFKNNKDQSADIEKEVYTHSNINH
jgi:hypothetical protein